MLLKRSLRSSALVLLVLVCTLSAGAQEITMEELLTELIAISTLLDKAQTEYQATSELLKTTSATLLIVTTEEIPTLQKQVADSKDSFLDYKIEVAEETRKLKIGLFAMGAACILSLIFAIIT